MATQTTQDFIPIKEIRDNVVVMKDGSMRAILVVSSINFALKSPNEKIAILLQYQNFLNSLDFQIQFFIQSRRLDILPYLQILENQSKEQTNELIKVQIREYIEFIKDLTGRVDIMSKSFFVVVPYSPIGFDVKKGILDKVFSRKEERSKATQAQDSFQENRTQLEQRVTIVEQGLSSVGLRSSILGTEELVELYFKIFNPDENATPTVQ